MPDFSVIIPVYNRPSELEELLDSLTQQTNSSFEVLVVEDGSTERAEEVVKKFSSQLALHYYYKKNSGPGLSRNFGCEKAKSNFFVFFDSDCIIPPHYFEILSTSLQGNDAFGGPDKAHNSFTNVQKAISYSMTSIFTTGGIRGQKKSVEKFHPRSFNMGFSRKVYEKTKGFSGLRFGEDIDLSIRIFEQGFTSTLIGDCYVYHKRRTTFKQFYKQVFNSGVARINLYKRHPKSLKVLHFFPSAFVLYQVLSIPHAFYHSQYWVLYPTLIYLLLILIDATFKYWSVNIGLLSVWASLVQLFGYGLGFIKGFVKRIILRQEEFHDFNATFYK